MNSKFYQIFREYQEISVRYNEKSRTVWCYYKPTPLPCFSMTVLKEALHIQHAIIKYFKSLTENEEPAIRYLIQASQVPDIFNLGGDLALFRKLIADKDKDKLLEYATSCVDICYLNAVSLHLPITTISLVQGAALGGGFESALASNVLIAEENAEMGFPEIRFNLFPGMGAYSLLARTLGIVTAEKMITSGKIYAAKELYDLGIVHTLAEAGKGRETVEKFIRQHSRSYNGMQAVQLARQRYHPISYEELMDITRIWVDAALKITPNDLRMMERLVKAQTRKIFTEDRQKDTRTLLRTKQDRRFILENITFPLADWSGKTVMFDRRKNSDRRLLHWN
ncbi:MAG: enoyl-CoA hydratase [Xanthomonadaceae bacterium]|nr:enoyl-CoA hydratase [Xanthomonadaceae bacterium]